MSSIKPEQKKCFVISPIGSKNSAERKRSDNILRFVIRPVCEQIGFITERADEIDEPGLISKKIIVRLFNADLVIADLTGNNPNVFYELAIRHATGKPVVHLIEHNEKIPFDVFDFNTIHIDHSDLESVEFCKEKLRRYIESCFNGEPILNPIIETIKTQNIELPFLRFEHYDLTKQFQYLSERLLKEIKTLRTERSVLIDKIVSDVEISQKTVKQHKELLIYDLSGIWDSSMGIVKLSQTGDEFLGEYNYKGVIGNIRGEIVNDRAIFQWNWQDLEGVGYWKARENEFHGIWFYSHQSCSYSELLENPTRLDTLITPNMPWILWKKIKKITNNANAADR